MSLENIEFIIFNKPFVSSTLNAAGRSLSISSTAIKPFTPLRTGTTSSDFVVGAQPIWPRTELPSLTQRGFSVDATCPHMPRLNGIRKQPWPPW